MSRPPPFGKRAVTAPAIRFHDDVPLEPAEDPYEHKTKEQLQAEKNKMLSDDGKPTSLQDKLNKAEKSDEEPTPQCSPLRGTFIFKSCVARERETPLNILHLFQPIMCVLLFLGLAFCALVALPIVQILLVTQAITSVCLVGVGLKVKDIPSQEKLNVELNKKIKKLGGMADGMEDHAETASKLSQMTLGWVCRSAETRDRMKKLKELLQETQGQFYEFRFKFQMLMSLANGEQVRFKEEESKLRKRIETEGGTMKEFNDSLINIVPDGLMNEDELTAVAAIIKDSTEDSENTIYSKVDDIIEAFVAGFGTDARWSKYATEAAYETKCKRVQQRAAHRGVGGLPPSALIDAECETAERRWSMKTIVNMIVETAKTDYEENYNASIQPWVEEYEKTQKEDAPNRPLAKTM